MGHRSVETQAPSNIYYVHTLTRHQGSYLASMEIGGEPCEAVVDSGATKTLVSRKFYEKMGNTSTSEKGKFIRTVSGQLVPVLAEITATFVIGQHSVDHTAWVVDLPEDCILGSDFLTRNACRMDFVRGTLQFPETASVPLKRYSTEERTFPAMLLSDVEIPANCEYIAPANCAVDENFGTQET